MDDLLHFLKEALLLWTVFVLAWAVPWALIGLFVRRMPHPGTSAWLGGAVIIPGLVAALVALRGVSVARNERRRRS